MYSLLHISNQAKVRAPVNAGVMAIVVHRAAKKGKAKAVAKVVRKAPAEVVEKILDMRTRDGLEEVFVKFKGDSTQIYAHVLLIISYLRKCCI
jgi:hypothetical protein